MTVTHESVPASPSSPSAMPLAHRLRAVVRIHLASPGQTLVMPWIITALIFGVNVAIWGMIAYSAGGADQIESGAFQSNGGISWLYVFMLVIAVQAMHFTFRFALGFSVTRRDYYLGTLVYFAAVSAYYALGLTALVVIERATGGWWLDGAFFAPLGLVGAPILTVAYATFGMLLLSFATGAVSATVWVRWGATGLYWMFGVLAALLIAFLWVTTVLGQWTTVWEFLTTTRLAILITWTLPVTALMATAGYALLRRAPARF